MGCMMTWVTESENTTEVTPYSIVLQRIAWKTAPECDAIA